MKKRSLLLSVVAAFGFTTATMAQVPNYVPTNGLVGWWPFNGNANDESGNGNNGTVNGATISIDRFGFSNAAYDFDGLSNVIHIDDFFINNNLNNMSISVWIKRDANIESGRKTIIVQKTPDGLGYSNMISYNDNSTQTLYYYNYWNPNNYYVSESNIIPSQNTWYNIVTTRDGISMKIYINGLLQNTSSFPHGIEYAKDLIVGGQWNFTNNSTGENFDGVIDDIGIWNRALTECEISDLYNAQLGSFSNSSVSINPTSSLIGSNATLTVSTPIQSLQWQSNPGNMGWNNIVNNNTYNGSTNDTLVVSNLQLSNQNQPFRLLACGDTSNVATIQIADTCITNVTVYDTLLTTVTDTLIINTTLSLPAPNNENAILIYPNPASDHITIDNGNYSVMAGYSIKITNNAGQEVFLNAINQQQFYVDLSTWTGNGLYFVHLIDPQNNTVTVRKIVLQ